MNTKLSAQTRPYVAKNGKQQFKPSLALTMLMNENGEGFCLACGEIQDCVEPDARQYECECCGAPKVNGTQSGWPRLTTPRSSAFTLGIPTTTWRALSAPTAKRMPVWFRPPRSCLL